MVYSSAHRQTANDAQAAEVAEAVFLTLAYRARKLGRNAVLAGWLFRTTRIACRKLPKSQRKRIQAPSNTLTSISEPSPSLSLWTNVAPKFDMALDRLPAKQRDAVLLQTLVGCTEAELAENLRISPRRAAKRVKRGLKRLARRLHKRRYPVKAETLALACALEGRGPAVTQGLSARILDLAEHSFGRKPAGRLVRRTLRSMAWARWRRRVKIGAPCAILLVATLIATGVYIDSRNGNSHLVAWFLEWSVRHQGRSIPGLAQAARSWPTAPETPALQAELIRSAADLYQITNIWLARLSFSADQWKSLEPRRVGPLPNFMQRDGTILLRNPKAHRSGLAGVLGYDFDWAHADFEFGSVPLRNVGARYKGNGTYLDSLYGLKRSFKVNLHKFTKGQQFGGVEEMNFSNLIEDRSYMSDALAYELFREAGVPAPRTAYAWLSISVAGQWDRKNLGLYLLVENLGSAFAAEQFGSKRTPIFKPVTYELFKDLGEDWSAYAAIYDLKTRATAAQERRVIEFSQLLSHASDTEFAQRLDKFLDLDEFAGFLAGLVFLSSYDSFLSSGQNFYLYLDPKSDKFGFIPWDLDHAWGGFPFIATPEERERASIWHPWVGKNRLLERVLSAEQFRKIYRARLEGMASRLFVPSRLFARIDEMARLLRSPVAAESTFRLERFDQAVSNQWLDRSEGGSGWGPDRPVHQLKRFIENRSKSVRNQLDGKSKGMLLKRL